MNFFDHKDLGNHLLQYCPQVHMCPLRLHTIGCGLVLDTVIITQRHSAFSTIASTLAWVDLSPVSHCVRSNPLQGVPSTPVTTSHMIKDTDLHITLQYVRGVGFMGGRFKQK